eukprot:CAMPEP_0175789016 /NCGR_PEP_ID=MMETSP0097-20121207/81183_1 /TAXON_ID=311494 /ORGANISM="Alexandrium monilatum, Strain CCMP3105" /LENGTH=37 /DNA_ID= /DNA_START= /DNA_END= /DNA_ORIENTATION=
MNQDLDAGDDPDVLQVPRHTIGDARLYVESRRSREAP